MSLKCCDIHAGLLDREILIQSRTLASDGQAGSTESWATITGGTVFAKIEPRSAGQVAYSETLQHRVTHKVWIRYMSGLTSDMRLVYGSRVLHIQGIRNLEERDEWLEIDANEGAPS